jgi:hypothetical protein
VGNIVIDTDSQPVETRKEIHSTVWHAAYNSDVFKLIIRRRYGFIIPTVIVFSLAFFVLFIIQSNYPDLVRYRLYGWINFNFVYTMLLFPVIWLGGLWFVLYIRKNVYPLEEELIAKYGGEKEEKYE